MGWHCVQELSDRADTLLYFHQDLESQWPITMGYFQQLRGYLEHSGIVVYHFGLSHPDISQTGLKNQDYLSIVDVNIWGLEWLLLGEFP